MSGVRPEALIEAASKLKDAVVRLGDAYDLMPPVIEKEHKALRAGDFFEVQAAVDTKENVGARIEECFAELTRACDALAVYADDGQTRPATLKECVSFMQALAAAAPADGLASQVLRHQVDGLARVAKEFDERFTKLKPQLEVNRALIATLLHNVQESYRYWQEVAEQVQTAYSPQGVQKTKGRYSAFVSKA